MSEQLQSLSDQESNRSQTQLCSSAIGSLEDTISKVCVKAELTENLVHRLSLQLEQQQQLINNLMQKAKDDSKQAELDR